MKHYKWADKHLKQQLDSSLWDSNISDEMWNYYISNRKVQKYFREITEEFCNLLQQLAKNEKEKTNEKV